MMWCGWPIDCWRSGPRSFTKIDGLDIQLADADVGPAVATCNHGCRTGPARLRHPEHG